MKGLLDKYRRKKEQVEEEGNKEAAGAYRDILEDLEKYNEKLEIAIYETEKDHAISKGAYKVLLEMGDSGNAHAKQMYTLETVLTRFYNLNKED